MPNIQITDNAVHNLLLTVYTVYASSIVGIWRETILLYLQEPRTPGIRQAAAASSTLLLRLRVATTLSCFLFPVWLLHSTI